MAADSWGSLPDASAGSEPIAFEDVVQTMADGVLVCDGGGRILYTNQQLEWLSGYSGAELLDRTVESLVPPGLRSAHETHREDYIGAPDRRSMGRELEIRLLRRDGSELPVDIALSPLGSGDDLRVIAVIRDLTGRYAADQRLREQAQLLEVSHDSVLIRNFADSIITYWNQGAVETYGFSRREAVGNISHTLLQTAFPVSREETDRLLLKNGRWDGELTHTRRDGARVTVSSRHVLIRDREGAPAGIFEVNRDITAERQATQQLATILDVTRAMISGAGSDLVLELIVSRARDLVGAAFAAMAVQGPGSLEVRAATGLAAERVQGMRFPAPRSLSGRLLATGKPVVVADLSAERLAHRGFADAVGAGPALFLPLAVDGNPVGIIILANPRGGRPFTAADQQTLEQLFGATAAVAVEYANARQTLRQVAQVEDRERIARDLHDGAIQTLFAVGMSVQSTALMTAEPGVAQRLTQNVTQLDDVIRELRGYIFDLRPAGSQGKGIATMLEELLARFAENGGPLIRHEIDGSVADALQARANDVRQIVVEGLSNVRRHADAHSVHLELQRDGESAVLVIADDGRGFVPGERRDGGQGLRNLEERAARIGGTIRIDSAPQAGTRIEIRLPL